MKDVIIVGGGAVGLWCAWNLMQSGISVTLVDNGDLTEGCSFGNAGMIVPSHFTPLASPGFVSKGIRWMFRKGSPFSIRPRMSLEWAQWLWQFYRSATKKHVAECAPLLRDMHMESREAYRQLNEHSGFQFQYEQRGILMLFKSLLGEQEELEAAESASQLDIEARQMTIQDLRLLEPNMQMDVRGAVYYPGDAHLTPHLFMGQMVQYLRKSGVDILTHQEVIHISDEGKAGCQIVFRHGNKMSAKQAILTSGIWSSTLMRHSGFRLPMQDGKGYSMTFDNLLLMPRIPSILHEARVAVTPMGDKLRIAGTFEISGMNENVNMNKVNSICKAVPEYYPALHCSEPGPVWSGYRPCPPDGMPYIGRWKKGSPLIIATGHAMMGLSLAPATGRIVRDICLASFQENFIPKMHPSRFS